MSGMPHLRRRGRARAMLRETRLLPLALCAFAFLAGYLVRPESMLYDRSAVGIVIDANNCKSISDCIEMGFPAGIFGFIRLSIPFPLETIEQWDVLLGIVGAITVVFLALWVSRCPALARGFVLLFAAVVTLSSTYVFILSKDVIQVFIFLIAFGVVRLASSPAKGIAIISSIFTLEGLVWRPYYFIVAVFIPVVYLLLRRLRSVEGPAKKLACCFAALAVFALVFSVVLKTVSPGSYGEIVAQHGGDREEYTATAAASGIRSFIEVNASSPPYLFVANWFINVIRILFPVELLLGGLSWWVFAVYQIAISLCVMRTVNRCPEWRVLVCVAVYLAFVLASGTFEPDFGSWVRHETATLPILLASVLCYVGSNSPRGESAPSEGGAS